MKYVGEEVDKDLETKLTSEISRSTTFDNSHNNIENSSSNGSLKQLKDADFTLANPNSDRNGQTIVSDSTGQYATALGGKSRAEGKRAVSAGT